MPFTQPAYRPPLFLRNGHVHTVYPALFRSPSPVPWKRQRITLADSDFIDLDWYRKGYARLIVLGHGLEGSTDRSYITAAANLFSANGFDVLAWNQRSCSGEMNRLPRFYHHGATEDLHEVLKCTGDYEEVHYVGYSLGGNVMLKYLGEGVYDIPGNFVSGVAISAPVDLPSCVTTILSWQNRLYHNRFLRSLIRKVREKHRMMPDRLSSEHLPKIRNLVDFDRYYTAPLHGFSSPQEYYTKASSRQYLPAIERPSLLLQARDDPMMGEGCYPREEGRESKAFHYLETRYGGHIAFVQAGSKRHWMEEVALGFILEHSATSSN